MATAWMRADSNAAALAKLATHRPDLVVCDANGETLELLDAVRQSGGLASRVDRDVPLIVLTARADELARVRYLDRGGDDVVAKPFGYPELRALACGRCCAAVTNAAASR